MIPQLQALGYAFWLSIHRAVWVSIALIAAYLTFLYVLSISQHGEKVAELMREEPGPDPFTSMLVLFPIAAALAAIASQGLVQRFLLPVSSTKLLLNTLINTVLLATVLYVATAAIAGFVFQHDWYFVKPLLLGVSTVLTAVGLAHLTDKKERMGGIAFCVATFLGIVTAELSFDGLDGSTHWSQIKPIDYLYAVSTSIVGISVLFWRISHRSPASEWYRARRFLDHIGTTLGNRKLPVFNSGREASEWLDWKTRGLPLPIITTVNVLFVAWFALAHPLIEGQASTTRGLDALLALWICFGFFYGLYIAHRGSAFEYLATLPISHRRFSNMKLKSAARAVICHWAIYMAGGLAIIHVIQPLNSIPAETILTNHGLQGIDAGTGAALLIAAGALLLTSWAILSAGLLFGTLPQKWQYRASIALAVLLLWYVDPSWPGYVIPEFILEQLLPVALIVSATYLGVQAASNGYADRVMFAAVITALLFFSTGFTLLADKSVLIRLTVSLLPIAAYVGMPVTIPYFRHRTN